MSNSEEIVILSLDELAPNEKSSSMKGKALIPWRKEPEGNVLKEKLVMMAAMEKIHLKCEESKETRWASFVDVLFKQPEFEIYLKITWRAPIPKCSRRCWHEARVDYYGGVVLSQGKLEWR